MCRCRTPSWRATCSWWWRPAGGEGLPQLEEWRRRCQCLRQLSNSKTESFQVLDKTNPQPIIDKVVAAKRKEIEAGVEGFMVYDLGLVQPCRQLWSSSPRYSPSSAKVTANSLLTLPPGGVTVNGLKRNIKVPIYTVNRMKT